MADVASRSQRFCAQTFSISNHGDKMNYSRTLIYAFLTACITLAPLTGAAQENSNSPYMNPRLTPEERAADLVHRMTLEEKATQLVNQARAIPRLNVPAYDWWSEA